MLRRSALGSSLAILSFFLAACASHPTDDSAIQNAVKAKLRRSFYWTVHQEATQAERGADQEVVNYIDVASSNGQVTLSGEVRSNRAKLKAEQIAKSVPGVLGVVNQLGVAPGYSDDAGDASAGRPH